MCSQKLLTRTINCAYRKLHLGPGWLANNGFFVGSKGEAREVRAALVEPDGVLACRALRIGKTRPWIEFWRGLLRSGCASLVAVVKSANLWDRNDGSAFRRVHGPWFRRVLGQREVCPGFVIIRQE